MRIVNFLLFTSLLMFGGCSAQHTYAPVEDLGEPPSRRIKTHVVDQGETLYSIAWRFGTTVGSLRTLNRLEGASGIYTGQILQVSGTHNSPQNSLASSIKNPTQTQEQNRTTVAVQNSPDRQVGAETQSYDGSSVINLQHTPESNIEVGAWVWPANGPVISEFESNNRTKQGIDISGQMGESVVAVMSGKVVYTGSALNGYGKLIIIEHSGEILTAYGHNERLLVTEGEEVMKGQKIALMGKTDSPRVQLLFEVRKNGEPVNPRNYLPVR